MSGKEEAAPGLKQREREKKKKVRRAEPGKEMVMRGSRREDGEAETANGDGEGQEAGGVKRQSENLQAEECGEVPESLVSIDEEDMDTSEGKKVQKKRKKKDLKEHTAESKCLDLPK